MLSRDLKFLAAWWDQIVERTVEFTPEGAVEFGRQLGLCIEAAETIEANCLCQDGEELVTPAPFVPAVVPVELPENVVRLKTTPRLAHQRKGGAA